MKNSNSLHTVNKKDIKTQNWVLICYGNILRSQVLEQYLKHYTKLFNIDIHISSAGVAKWEEFPNTKELLLEVQEELNNRNIANSLNRNAWSNEVEAKIVKSDIVICADSSVKQMVTERMNGRINLEKISTFYNRISEGEVDFQDTYDYEKNRQDPIRFRNAFDELDRIAKKILSTHH